MLGSDAPDYLKFTIDDWLQVTDRAIRLVGEDHVILGTDFDGGPTLPLPMHDISDVPLIIGAMRRRGYSDERIQKIMGGNLLRVFRQITNR
jgi:membrane dipeptidase